MCGHKEQFQELVSLSSSSLKYVFTKLCIFSLIYQKQQHKLVRVDCRIM